ncbi:MAG: NRDE family protein [Rhodospirillales bacterium]|nr:NRDE family protein [Alphaproteobacteria bacterium]MBL6947055.1 NRDE family protein [Rhodospirillales bacterium]
MCTVVILRRPGHDWPLILAANRDEMADRAWRAPGRHWPDRAEITAGLDEEADGTWLGLNDWGVIAAVLNRPGSLGPDPDKRSRGELPLEALDHAEAAVAADALAAIDPASYRSFNMVIADAAQAFWLCSLGNGAPVRSQAIGEGLSIITAHDLNDTTSRRIRHYKPLFEAASPPDVENGDWTEWRTLLADRQEDAEHEEKDGMTIVTKGGFGTVSSSLLALPAPERFGVKPRWLFAPGRPDAADYEAVET